jgi:hypothetical protein
MRKRVSGGIAMFGCACRMVLSSVVPERGQPTRKIGRDDIPRILPNAARNRFSTPEPGTR